MSNLEHAIENALVCIENGKSFKEFAEKENSLGNLNGISATVEEIWRIAEYVKYTYCNVCEFEVFACEHYKDKSLIVELPCRVGDTVYVCYESPKGISETTIARFEIYGKFTTVVFSNGSQFTIWNNDWSVYKSAVFLSREDAERALEEINNEKNNN